MSLATNLACLQQFGFLGMHSFDNMAALNANSQSLATRLFCRICRVVTSVGTGSVVLPAQLTGENDQFPCVLINDSPNSLNLFPAAGETINALGANASIAVAAGKTALCVANDVPPAHGGVATGSNLNWVVMIG